MTKEELYKLIDTYEMYGVPAGLLIDYKYNGPYDNTIQSKIADLDNWHPDVAANKGDEIAKLIRYKGDKFLNTYPNLVKDNISAFFDEGDTSVQDAVDDYIADKKHWSYTTLQDLLDSEVSPEDFAAGKQDLADMIIQENKAMRNKKIPEEIIDALNRRF